MELKDTTRYADIFAALGSQPRLEIMRLLFTTHPNGMTVGDIQAQLKIPNSTLSHHLEKLRIEGLVNSKKDKQYLWYSANAETMEDLLSFFYTGSSRSNRVIEPVNVISTESGFMFQNFFGSIFERLFGFTFDKFFSGFLKFTDKARQAIELAQNESLRLGHEYVGTEQILLGLISEGTGIAAQLLNSAGVNFETARIEVEKIIGCGRGLTPRWIPFTPRAKLVLELSAQEARHLDHDYVGTEHLLLGIIHERGGLAVRVLENLGVNLQNLEQQVRGAMN